jgi:tetratricopeptide (TPR) repeat protein
MAGGRPVAVAAGGARAYDGVAFLAKGTAHMKIQGILLGALFGAMSLTPANAVQAVATFGGSHAGDCYRNAANDRSYDSTPCDAALAGALAQRDRKSTLVNRGIIHKRNGNLQRALDDFNAALEIDPDLAEAYLNRGSVYFLAGNAARAIEDYEQSLHLGTQRPWAAWYNMGLAYEQMNDREKAREAFANAVAANPRFTDARRKLAEYS